MRDTGVGMSEKDIATALEPFRQLATSARGGSGGTGLGLPLTKALAEANRARFTIKSAVNAGTLVEVAFPGAPDRRGIGPVPRVAAFRKTSGSHLACRPVRLMMPAKPARQDHPLRSSWGQTPCRSQTSAE